MLETKMQLIINKDPFDSIESANFQIKIFENSGWNLIQCQATESTDGFKHVLLFQRTKEVIVSDKLACENLQPKSKDEEEIKMRIHHEKD